MAYLPTIDKKIQTVSALITTIASIPVPQNTVYYIEVRVLAYKSDYSSVRGGRVSGCFARGTGSVVKDGNIVNDLAGTLTGAAIVMVANTVSQTADIQVSGLAATVNWNLAIDVLINT